MHWADILIAWMWIGVSIVCFMDCKQRFIPTCCLQPQEVPSPRCPKPAQSSPKTAQKSPKTAQKKPKNSSKPLPQRAAEPIPPWGHLTITEVQDVTESSQQTISIKHNIGYTTFFHLNCVKIKGKKLHFTERACGTERWGTTGGTWGMQWWGVTGENPVALRVLSEVITGHKQWFSSAEGPKNG